MPNDDDGQDHMFRFIPLKEVDRSATFGEVATPKLLHDTTIRQEIDRSMHALFAQLASPALKCSRDLLKQPFSTLKVRAGVKRSANFQS